MGRSLISSTYGKAPGLAENGATLVTVTGKDAFNVGDPVFYDLQRKEFINRSNSLTADSLAAEPSVARIVPYIEPSTPSARGASAAAKFNDGSYLVAQLTQTKDSTDNLSRAVINQYDSQGTQTRQDIWPLDTDLISYWMIVACSMPISDFVAVAFGRTYDTTHVQIYSKTNGMVQQVLVNGHPTSLTATSTGVLCVTTAGIFHIATGATGFTTIYSAAIGANAINMTNGSDAVSHQKSNWVSHDRTDGSIEPFPISSGGFGIMFSSASNLLYYRINSDGSLRGTTTVRASTTGPADSRMCIAIGASGNILWMYTNDAGTYWGIVSDAGATVKAAVLIASSDPILTPGLMRIVSNTNCIADANGDFLLTWSSSNGTSLQQNYVSGVNGTSKTGFPRSDTLTAIEDTGVLLYKVSTGIYVAYCLGSHNGVMNFYLNSGTLQVSALPLPARNGGSWGFTINARGTVANDALYLWFNLGDNSVPKTNNCILKFNTIGQITTNCYSYQSFSTAARAMLYADATDVIAAVGGTFIRYDATTLQCLDNALEAKNVEGDFLPALFRFYLHKFGDTFVVTHSTSESYDWTVLATWPVAYLTGKARSSLLGIATTQSSAGGPVTVQTKGVLPTTWKTIYYNFDQTGSVYPGNSGSFLGGTVILKGLDS